MFVFVQLNQDKIFVPAQYCILGNIRPRFFFAPCALIVSVQNCSNASVEGSVEGHELQGGEITLHTASSFLSLQRALIVVA